MSDLDLLFITEGIGDLLGVGFMVLYGWAIISTLLRYKITGEYIIDSGLLGPTEVRIIISAILITEAFIKGSIIWISALACFILLTVDIRDMLRLLRIAAEKVNRIKTLM